MAAGPERGTLPVPQSAERGGPAEGTRNDLVSGISGGQKVVQPRADAAGRVLRVVVHALVEHQAADARGELVAGRSWTTIRSSTYGFRRPADSARPRAVSGS